MNNNTQIIDKLKQRYGDKEGMRIFMTVMPGITADFQKMLLAASPDKTVQEEYHLDDGKTTMVLTGSRDAQGKMSIFVTIL